MIEANRLTYRIDTAHVLHDINMSIRPGKVTAILGPNGAGKTSLLKCLSGTIKNYTGDIKYNNQDIHDYSLLELSLKRAVLSQANLINFPFSVMEIVTMGRNPHIYNNDPKGDLEIVIEALNTVDALHLKNRIFPTLSGGEQQRVQLARVLAQIWEQENVTLFLDEPTSALDLKHQHQVMQLVNKLSTQKAISVVCILHDLNLALHYTDYAILMNNGVIHISGRTNDILNTDNIENVYQISSEIMQQFYRPQHL
jgi:heme transport system ATP-binding protein